MTNNTESYMNAIKLLEQALNFYAQQSNYESYHPMVMVDLGAQARFALNKVKEITEMNEKLEADYNTQIEAMEGKSEEEILNTLSIFKDISNENNNI